MAEEYLTDDEQWEAIKRGIAENGLWIVGGLVLGAVLLVGWRYYQTHQNEAALQAAARFSDMTGALDRNDRNTARQMADGLIKNFPASPYADQAQLLLARLFVDDGQLPSAVAPLTRVMMNSKDAELKHIARLRLARVLTDEGKPDEAIQTLTDDGWGAFAATAHEVRGDAYYAKKDFKNALTEYRAAQSAGDVGAADSALLELKVADLAAAAAPALAMTPGATLPNKAKP